MKHLLFGILFMLSASAFAEEGKSVGGGGTIVYKDGNPMLLDLYGADKREAKSGYKLPDTKSLEKIHLDTIGQEHPIFQKALARSREWKESSPTTVRLLEQALGNLQIYYTDYRIKVKDENRFVPKAAKNLPQRSGAFYFGNLGVIVSKSDFEALDEENQIALLLHESFRHITLDYGFATSDKVVQEMVVRVMTGDSQKDSLDNVAHWDQAMRRVVSLPKAVMTEKEQVHSRFCGQSLQSMSPSFLLKKTHFCSNSLTEQSSADAQEIYRAGLAEVNTILTEKGPDLRKKALADLDQLTALSLGMTMNNVHTNTLKLGFAGVELGDVFSDMNLNGMVIQRAIKDANESWFMEEATAKIGKAIEKLATDGVLENSITATKNEQNITEPVGVVN
jgi:hypothetical protein